MIARLLAAAAALLLVPAATATAAATVYSPSNIVASNPDDGDADLLLDELKCAKRTVLPRPGSRTAAIARAWTALGRVESARALRAFRASAANRRAAAITPAVLTAVTVGRPGAALAASLRGAELEPGQPRHLVNAAVLLLGYGRVREANGLLAAASAKAPGAPFTISQAAALAAAKGEVALASGQFAAAERAYRAAARQAPLLAEARAGVAHALKCQGKRGPAARWLRRSQRRIDKTGPGGTPADPEAAPTVEDLADPGSQVDIAKFGTFRRAANPVDAAANEGLYKAAYDAALERPLALSTQADAAFPVGSAEWRGRAAKRWVAYVAARIEADPELERLDAAALALRREWLGRTALVESRPACYYSSQHADLWDLHARRAANLEASARRYHRVMTALAAHMGIPGQSLEYNLKADQYVAELYANLMQLVYYTAREEAFEVDVQKCGGGGGAPGGATGQNAPENASPKSDPCTAAKIERIKFKLGATASAEFSCDGGKVEVVPVRWGPDQAYIGAFGEAGVKWKNGDITAVAGVKAAVGTKGIPGLPEVGVSTKIGAYVTAGRVATKLPEYGGQTSWTVKDWGIRIANTAEIPGPVAGKVMTITKFDDKTDISLVGVFGGSN